MSNYSFTELLAPAGKWDALVAAVQNGADAVYIGEKSFSARKNASNFTWEEIEKAARYCHVRGVRVFLALNTLVADNELEKFEKSVLMAAKTGVDAIIVQDIGCAEIIKSVCPEMEIHASTQLTSSNKYDVEALVDMGFSRVVLSRELSEKEIRRIYDETGAELEAFVHGALCISFSGKCLMSSFIGGRSGNRGMCAQPCRQMYSCNNKKGYLLSPRDLCLADELKNLYSCGVVSFKIEGRMKSPEYVASVTNVYRKYLDTLAPLRREDEGRLEKIFVRGDGFTKGYFSEKNTPEIMNYSISNDNLSSRADESVLKEARASFREGVENKKIPVSATLEIHYGRKSSLTLCDRLYSVTFEGDEGEVAQNTPLSKDRAQAQIGKMGQTPFVLNEFAFYADENITASASLLNALRRGACELLLKKREEIQERRVYSYKYPDRKEKKKQKPFVTVSVMTKNQFASAKDADRILVPIYLWNEIVPDERCFVLLPQVVTDEQKVQKILSKIPLKYGVYASSPGMIMLAKEAGREVYADWSCNIYNSVTANVFGKSCKGITLSPELSLSEIREIASGTDVPCEAVCHGYQTVMTSRACLIRGITGKCDCSSPIKIKDKTGAQFAILGDRNTHLNTVLNSRVTFMADKLKDLFKTGVSGIRLMMTIESGEETLETIAMYKEKTPVVKPAFFTRGYLMNK